MLLLIGRMQRDKMPYAAFLPSAFGGLMYRKSTSSVTFPVLLVCKEVSFVFCAFNVPLR